MRQKKQRHITSVSVLNGVCSKTRPLHVGHTAVACAWAVGLDSLGRVMAQLECKRLAGL